MAIVGIIPARDGFPRLPGKPPSASHGRTSIEKASARVRGARRIDREMGENGAGNDALANLGRERALPAPEKGRVA